MHKIYLMLLTLLVCSNAISSESKRPSIGFEGMDISKICRDSLSDSRLNCIEEDNRIIEIVSLCHEWPKLCNKKTRRLSSYQPNYVVYKYTEGDEYALETHYSFKYMLTKSNCLVNGRADLECLRDYKSRNEFFFSYTGEFDFYVDLGEKNDKYGRDSGPVINRLSNPAFHYRWNYGKENHKYEYFGVSYLNLGFEHRSNGQVVEYNETLDAVDAANNGKLLTQIAYESNDHEYFDALSRGSNYFLLEARMHIGKDYRVESLCDASPACFDLWVSLKGYVSMDSDVNWGPLEKQNHKIDDYDILKLTISDTFTFYNGKYSSTLGMEWTLGKELLDTDSFDFNIELGKPTKPRLYIRVHVGPMNTLSNYTLKQNSIGIGVRFM